MTKTKRKHVTLEDVLERPWCYYCERDFDDVKILVAHQRAKHFKCERCNKRMNTAGGLSVHMNQVHKETLLTIENALPNRSGPDVEVFGTEGIPPPLVEAHNQRVTQEYYSAEAAHRASTGNSVNQNGSNVPKKLKVESAEDIKQRLAEHKAKKAAELAAKNSGQNTPDVQTASPQAVHFQHVPPQTQGTPPQAGFPPMPNQFPPYGQQPSPFPLNGGGYPVPPMHQQQGPFPPPGQFGHPQPQFSPPQQYGAYGQPQIPTPIPPQMASHMPPQPFALFQGYPPNPSTNFQQPAGPGPRNNFPGAPGFPPTNSFHGSPTPGTPMPFPRNDYGPPQAGSSNGGAPPDRQPLRQNSLPSAPGLPQRPNFDAPQVSRSELQNMHKNGQIASHQPQSSPQEDKSLPGSLDDLIASAQQNAQPQAPAPERQSLPAAETAKDEKPKAVETDVRQRQEHKTKRPEEKTPGGKKKNTRTILVASPNVSFEERMADLERYGKKHWKGRSEKRILGPVEAAVTGPVRGSDDVADNVQQ